MFVLPASNNGRDATGEFWPGGGPKRRKAIVSLIQQEGVEGFVYDVLFDGLEETSCDGEEDGVPPSRLLPVPMSIPNCLVEWSSEGLQAAMSQAAKMKKIGNVNWHSFFLILSFAFLNVSIFLRISLFKARVLKQNWLTFAQWLL